MQSMITSLQNPHIKNLVKLRQRRQRDQQQLMLIDGARALTLALRNNFLVESLYYCPTLANPILVELAQHKGVRMQPVSQAVLQKIGYGDNPDGHLGLASQPKFSLADLPNDTNPLYLIAEGLEKPGNLGAILRSADAAGISGLIVCHSQTDIYNPNVIRASQGTFFSVPLAVINREGLLVWLHKQNVTVYAATPGAEQPYTTADMTEPTALVVGTEAEGLTETWSDFKAITIPMVGQVDSLNVAQTATLLMFEAVRQRSAG